MRVFIVADIEGAVGIYRRSQCFSLKPEYQFGRQCLTDDLNAIAQGAFDGGAESVIVRDTHESGRNVIVEKLDPRCEYIGGHFIEPAPILGDLKKADAVFLAASHARSGAAGAFFPHTFFGAFNEVKINGQPVGEAFIYAASLAEIGIPVAFNSGDAAAIQESLSFMPWMKTVVVPKEEDFYSAPDAPEKVAALRESLRQAAQDAVKDIDNMKLFAAPAAPSWEVVVKDAAFAQKINKLSLDIDGASLKWKSETYIEGFTVLFKLVQASFMAMMT